MGKVTVVLETTEHRIWKIGEERFVDKISYTFVERIEKDPITMVDKQKMYLQVKSNGVITETPLGDSKIPPSVG